MNKNKLVKFISAIVFTIFTIGILLYANYDKHKNYDTIFIKKNQAILGGFL